MTTTNPTTAQIERLFNAGYDIDTLRWYEGFEDWYAARLEEAGAPANADEIIAEYNGLLDRFFDAATITESDEINRKMEKIFWEIHKQGYHFKWAGNRVAAIIPYAA